MTGLDEKIIELMQDTIKHMHTMDHTAPEINHDISLIQLRIASIIREHGTISMTKLAQLMNVKGASMTAHIDALRNAEIVKRQRSSEDRRSVMVSLSDKGEALFQQVFAHKMQSMSKLLATLNNQDKQQFITLLQKINSAFISSVN